jgi:hypothetical protein
VIVVENGAPRFALAPFGTGEFPEDFAVLSAVLHAAPTSSRPQ